MKVLDRNVRNYLWQNLWGRMEALACTHTFDSVNGVFTECPGSFDGYDPDADDDDPAGSSCECECLACADALTPQHVWAEVLAELRAAA